MDQDIADTARGRLARPTGPVLRFIVPMKPVPKERPRFAQHTYTATRTRRFEEAVAWYARIAQQEAGWDMLEGPVLLDVVFCKPPARADLSNLVKSLEDAIQGVLIKDDVQIIGEALWREPTGPPSLLVELIPLEVDHA